MYKMSKPKCQKDTTMEELDELMTQAEMDSERLALYLQRKVEEHQKPKKNDQRLFGRFSFDMDLDVNALKKPKQPPPPAEPSDVQPLKERVSGAPDPGVVASGLAKEPPADPSATENNPPPSSPPAARTSPSLSPNRRRSQMRSGNVPGSDKLRRHAIRRRSQSCGRQLIKEFEESINVTRSSSSPTNFKPGTSSTPCTAQPPKDSQAKEPAENPQEIQLEKPEAEKSQVAPETNTAAEASLMYRERQSSYQNNILQLDYTGRAPYPRPESPTSPSINGVGRTYTIEKGPAPGQLLLSPSRPSPRQLLLSPSRPSPSPGPAAAQKPLMPIVKIRRPRVEVPETPPRALTWQSEPEPECVVPDTQPQDLSELVQNLSRNASGPIVVINTASPKPPAEREHAQPVSVVASPLHRASTVVSSASLMPAASPPALVAASPAKLAESPRSTRSGLLVVGNVDAIMTDDESDEQPSTVAMNLAPPGGDTTRQRRLRNRNNRPPTPDRIEDSSVQLLNLHRSINAKESKRRPKPSTVPLNKAPSTPINGEQFAEELARMSNYEILDLRKRNSLGKVYPLNGHRKRIALQQLDLERNIQFELMRRNLTVEGDQFSANDESPDDDERLPPRDTNKRKRSRRSSHSKEYEEMQDHHVLPPPPSLNIKDTRKRTQQSPPSRRQNPLISEESADDYEPLPPPAPHDFEDSRKQMQRSLRARHRSARISEDSSDVNEELPPPVPRNFEDSRKQTLRSNRQSRRMKTNDSGDDISWLPPPAPSAFKDTSKRKMRSSRAGRRNTQVSKELSNYLMISQTMETRRKTLRDSTKRKLYTKGDSYTENSDSDSPVKRPRNSRSLTVVPNREENDLEIVPPPPASLRYSQSLRDFRQMNRVDLDNVGSQESAIIEIDAPPPPENCGRIWVNRSLGQESNEQDVIPEETSVNNQPRESEIGEEHVLPPPMEYTERPDEAETDSIPSLVTVQEIIASQSRSSSAKKSIHNQSTAKTSQESGLKNKKKKGVPPATVEYNDDEDPRESVLGAEHDPSPASDHNERPDEPETESVQSTLADHEKTSLESRSASTKKSIHNQSAAKTSKEPGPSSSSHHGQKKMKNKVVSPPTEYDLDMEEASETAPSTGAEQGLPPPTEPDPEFDETETESAQSLSRSTSAKKKTISNLKTLKVSQEPGPERESSSRNRSTLQAHIATDHEEPSTSLAARKALQRSIQKENKKTKPQVVADDETVFKKPLAPAPRAKAKSKEVEKLMHSVLYFPTSLDDGSITSEGIRRSRRGHVPIKNTWCHTQDIMDMPFMSGTVKKPKSTKKSVEKKKATSAKKIVASNPPPSDRGPLYSSTPRNPDRMVDPFPDSVSLGLEPLNWEQSEILPNTKTSKKPSETHLDPEPLVTEPPKSCSNQMDNQMGDVLQLTNWLRGASNDPPCNMTEQSGSASHVGDMRFTELDGIDYAFYNTKEKATVGYMRFKPHQVRNKKRAKAHPLKFIVQFGEFAVQRQDLDAEEEESCILHAGDMIEIDKDSRYSIQNILNDVSVLLVIRC